MNHSPSGTQTRLPNSENNSENKKRLHSQTSFEEIEHAPPPPFRRTFNGPIPDRSTARQPKIKEIDTWRAAYFAVEPKEREKRDRENAEGFYRLLATLNYQATGDIHASLYQPPALPSSSRSWKPRKVKNQVSAINLLYSIFKCN